MDNNGWTREVETILYQISDKSYTMSNTHKQNYFDISNRLKYFKIPVIILSGINSVISVGLTEYLDQSTISATTCLLALVVGIIGSIELFLKLNESLQNEYNSGKEFGLLHVNVAKMLMLSRAERSISGQDYLNDVFGQYITLIGNSNLIVSNVLHHGSVPKVEPVKISVMEQLRNKMSPSPSPSLSSVEMVELHKSPEEVE